LLQLLGLWSAREKEGGPTLRASMFIIIKLGNEKDPRLEILIDYFNSPMGLLCRCKADLETLITAMAFSKFRVRVRVRVGGTRA
jgi:hypothetical protein